MAVEVALDDGGYRSQVGYRIWWKLSSLLGLRYLEPVVLEEREVEAFTAEDLV